MSELDPETTIGNSVEESTSFWLAKIARLEKELTAAWKERDDWRWAYQLTEGVLKSDKKWVGVNERFSNGKIIEAAKLAKVAMGKVKPAPPVPLAPDKYRELMEWIGRGLWRKVQCRNKGEWMIRDEALSREIAGRSLEELLRSELWGQLKKL